MEKVTLANGRAFAVATALPVGDDTSRGVGRALVKWIVEQ